MCGLMKEDDSKSVCGAMKGHSKCWWSYESDSTVGWRDKSGF